MSTTKGFHEEIRKIFCGVSGALLHVLKLDTNPFT